MAIALRFYQESQLIYWFPKSVLRKSLHIAMLFDIPRLVGWFKSVQELRKKA